jgi:beta-N-acetylhexosaminidase
MSLRDDLGQLFSIGFEGTTLPPEAARLLQDGRVGGVILFTRNVEDVDQLCALQRAIQEAGRDDESGSPVLVSVDQEGGRVQRLKAMATDVPSMRQVGLLSDLQGGQPDVAYRVGALLAREVGALGFGINFAPVVDVDTNPANPVIGQRSFSARAEVVGRLGAAFIRGHQEAGVAACAKHFPGHGDTDLDSHLSLPRLSHPMERLDAVELPPFQAAVDAGVAAVMTAHVVFAALDPEVPATLSPRVLRAILRERMVFEGVVISDDLEMKAVADHHAVAEMVGRGIAASVDHFLCCKDLARAAEALEAATRLAERDSRVRDAVRVNAGRVRALKRRFLGTYAPPDPQEARAILRAPAHLKLAEQVRQAVASA